MVCVFSIVLPFLIASAGAAVPPQKPNIVVFLADDLGYGDPPAYNSESLIPMPNLDQLAAHGMRFTDAHAATSMCAPTRYTTLTGNYQWRGLLSFGQWNWKGGSQILDGQWTLGDVLQQQGYTAAFIGKYHLGAEFYRVGGNDFVGPWEPDSEVDLARPMVDGPLDRGFDYAFAALYGIQHPPYAYHEDDHLYGDPAQLMTWAPGQYGDSIILNFGGVGMPYWDSSQVGPDLAANAIAFIDRHHQENLAQGTNDPFFLYYASQSAHSPFSPPAAFLGEPVKGVTGLNAHADMIYEIDVALGKLLDALEQRGLADDTLIIFTSDNGGFPGVGSGHQSNGSLRGYKSEIWEGGHRVPMVAKWGDGTPAGSTIPPNTTSDQLIGTHDLMATIAALVGQPLPADQAHDSFDFLPVFLGTVGDGSPIRDHIIMEADKLNGAHANRHFAYREGPWKLVFDPDQNVIGLYNLDTDLEETQDLKDDPSQAGRIALMASNFQTLHASERTSPSPVPEPGRAVSLLFGAATVWLGSRRSRRS